MSTAQALTMGLLFGIVIGFFLRLIINHLNNRTYQINEELREVFKDVFIRQVEDVDVHFTIGGDKKEREAHQDDENYKGPNEFDMVFHARIINGTCIIDEQIPGKVSYKSIKFEGLTKFRKVLTELYNRDYRDKSLLIQHGLKTGLLELKSFRFTLYDETKGKNYLFEYFPEHRRVEDCPKGYTEKQYVGYVGFHNTSFPKKDSPQVEEGITMMFDPYAFYENGNNPPNQAGYDLDKLRDDKNAMSSTSRIRYLVYLLSKKVSFVKDGKRVHEPRLKRLREVPSKRHN
jgi:hypothetical protein